MAGRGEKVILVDAEDRVLGFREKMQAHESGELHRAVSIFVFDEQGRLLLQRRAFSKYHSGGLWANSCCSHPRMGESAAEAASRRLDEELGVTCELVPAGTCMYRAEVGQGLTEHELVHLFAGRFVGEASPNPEEVESCRWESIGSILSDMAVRPERYAAWFRHYASVLDLGKLADSFGHA